MKDERRNYILVGLFVVAMGAALIVWLAVLSGQTGAADFYSIRYESVLGVRQGTQVYFQGFPIGVVEEITPHSVSDDPMFEVSAKVARGWAIPKDSIARIAASGLLSAVVIDIQAGTSSERLRPGDRIKSVEATSLMTVVTDAASEMTAFMTEDLRPQLDSLVTNMDTAMAQILRFVAPENAANVARILENLGSVSEETEHLMIGLESTRSDLDRVVGRIDAILDSNDEDVRSAVADLQHAVEALALRSEAVAANLEETTRNASEFSRQIRSNPGVLLRGLDAPAGAGE